MGSSGSVPVQDGMHVVIVGGGYGGTCLAVKLRKSKFCKVTLIDPKEAMLHNIGAVRTVVDESYANKLFIPYDQMLGDSFMRGKAVELNTNDKHVLLESGEKVSYTILVIATGSRSPFPSKLDEVAPGVDIQEGNKLFSDYRKEVQSAKKILLVGGGAVGVELAGEIKTEHRDKEVTIINSRAHLVSTRAPDKFQKALAKAIQNKGISVLHNERVSNLSELTLNKHQEDQIVKTESGKELKADMVIPCTGTKPNNQFFKEALGQFMTEHGALQVDEFLKVKGQDNVYAIGDINDVPEEKMAYTAKLQADALFHNLKNSATNGKSKAYKPGEFAILVPLGRDGGVALFKGILLGGFAVSNIKGKDMFAGMMWKDLGLKAPH